MPCTRGPDGGDCGCCQACCQGIQKCGRCTKCWALGIGCRPKYVKEEEAARLRGNTRAAGKRGRERSEDAERRTEAENTEDAEERTEAEITEGEGSGQGNPGEGESEAAPTGGAGAVVAEDAVSHRMEERTDDEATVGTPGEGFGAEGEESEGEDDDDSFEPQDYWERTGDQLIRHHVTRRNRLFDPQDMVNGIARDEWQLGHTRRTEILTPGGSRAVIHDEWRVHPGINPGYGLWTGSTAFTVGHAVNEEPVEEDDGGENDEPEGGESEQYEPSDPEDEDGDGGGVRSGGGDSDRDGAGQFGRRSEEEPEPEAKFYQAPSESAKVMAEKYVDIVQKGFANEAELWEQLVSAGNGLLSEAGSVAEAAKSLWQVREEKGLANLAGIESKSLDRVLHPDLLAYLRDVRTRGMAARFCGPRTRVRTRLHPNARKNLDQVYKQIAKDVGKHRVLLVGSDHPGLRHAVCSPFETVAKMNPDRTISTEQRLVHDQRGINAGTSKYLHPPAVQPSHAQIARRILWHRVRCPNTPILMAKKDIAGAFRLLWVDPADVELFGGDLPWKPEAFQLESWEKESVCEQGITVLYLVSSFGFSGSPGEWTAWGRATEEYHRGFRPGRSRRDLSVGFDAKVLVDDCVLVEPYVGLRPWVSAEVYEDGVRTMLGSAAVNKEKDKVEGEFRTTQTVWGVIMDTQSEKAFLPEKRIQKGAALVAANDFDYGEKTVTLKQMQQFRGIMTGWSSVIQGLKNELKAADRFLGGKDGRVVVAPKLQQDGSASWEAEVAWQELWELFEVCRWLSGRSDVFGTSLREMLAPMERLSLPGEWKKVVVVSSDATPTYVGAIDWTNQMVFRQSVAELKPWIDKVLNDKEKQEEAFEELAIHLAEMLSFTAFACEVGSAWHGSVVIYGGDNTVVKQWLETRRSGVRAGRLLIRVVNMVEARYGCTILAGWWRTYHNVDADLITRCTNDEFREYVKKKGWKEVDVGRAVRQALEDTERFGPCFLSWADPSDRVDLMQLKERRMLRQLQKELVIPWESYVVMEWAQVGRKIRDFEGVAMRMGATTKKRGEEKPTILCASLSMDPYGKHLQRFMSEAKDCGAWAAVVEGPRAVAWELGEKRCKLEGWSYGLVEYVTSEMSEVLARKRRALVIQTFQEPVDWSMALVKAEAPVPMQSVLRPSPWDAEGVWERPERLEVKGGIPREPMLPQAVGHCWWGGDEERKMVYGMGGPGRWPLAEDAGKLEEMWVYDRTGPPGCLRKVSENEIWRLQGRTEQELREAERSYGLSKASLVFEGTRATGVHTAANLLAVVGYIVVCMQAQSRRAGMGVDIEGAKAMSQILLWLRRWRRGEMRRSAPAYAGGRTRCVYLWVEAWWFEHFDDDEDWEECTRAGGRKRKVEDVVASAAVAKELTPPRPFRGDVGDRVEEWVEEHLAGDKASSTEKAYQGSWTKWRTWARRQGWISEYLNYKDDPVENENKVLAFVGYMGWLGASAATLKQAIFAIKDAHKRAGCGDPTEKMHRLWMLVNALERKAVRKPRRLGVTPQMLEWLGSVLVEPFPENSVDAAYADSVMVMASMVTAWFFMLRAKEYCDSNGVDYDMVLRGTDLRFTTDGKVEPGKEPNEITMQFRKTKSDQLAFGESKTLKATGRRHLCPVEALVRMRRKWPTRFQKGHSDSLKPLFRWASGQALRRTEVQSFLQQAARGVGLPPERFMSHSLRIGGATALYQSTGEIEVVKRMGRWSSSAVQRYLHDGGDTLPRVSQKMAELGNTTYYA